MSPPASPNGSPPATKPSRDLSLDLTSLPPLVWPSPPSNTLLITKLNNPATFHPASLEKIRDLLSSPTPLNSFSPLRSFHRIIVSYPTIDAAVAARELLESPHALPLSSSLSSSSTTSNNQQQPPQQQHRSVDQMKIYFGSPTPILGADAPRDQHLQPPAMGKLLFISPPPSPPCGWEIREEDPPNKETHAEDLQKALAGLGGAGTAGGRFEDDDDDVNDGNEEMGGEDDEEEGKEEEGKEEEGKEEEGKEEEEELDGFGKRKTEGTRAKDVSRTRRKSLTTMVYHPRDHGDREDLPAVTVEDTSGAAAPFSRPGEEEEERDDAGQEGGETTKKIMAHTARPPVELMD